MAVFERGDVVRVPFPYTDRSTRQHRPALVVSHGAIGHAQAMIWVVMITSAANRGWPGDVRIRDNEDTGLPVPSLIRTEKIATIEARHADRIGRVGSRTWRAVESRMRAHLGMV